MRNSKRRNILQKSRQLAYILAFAFLIVSMIVGISVGSVSVPVSEIFQIIGKEIFHLPLSTDANVMFSHIVMKIRLPRVILAGLVGGSLAISGAAFQGLLRNPLADPYTLGVSSGASVWSGCNTFLWVITTCYRVIYFAITKRFVFIPDDFLCAVVCTENGSFDEGRDNYFNRDHF